MLGFHAEGRVLGEETIVVRKVGESFRIGELQAEPLVGHIHHCQSWRQGSDDVFFMPVFEVVAASGIQDEFWKDVVLVLQEEGQASFLAIT